MKIYTLIVLLLIAAFPVSLLWILYLGLPGKTGRYQILPTPVSYKDPQGRFSGAVGMVRFDTATGSFAELTVHRQYGGKLWVECVPMEGQRPEVRDLGMVDEATAKRLDAEAGISGKQ